MANYYEQIVNEAYEPNRLDTILNTTQQSQNNSTNVNNEKRVYDADTVYSGSDGYRIQGIDAPEMPSQEVKLDRLLKAKEAKLEMFVSKATAGEAAKMEAQLSTLNENGIDNISSVQGKDYYGRNLTSNPEYQNDLVKRGYAVAAFDNRTAEANQLMEEARANKRGLWADPEYAKEMEAVRAKRNPELVTEKDNDGYFGNLVDAAQYGIGRTVASTADTVVDAVTRGSKELAELGGVTEKQSNEIIQESALKNLFNSNGDFVGLDKYKQGSEYGYDDARVREYTDEFKKTFTDPKADWLDKVVVTAKAVTQAPEVLASSVGDMVLAAIPGGMGVFAANFTNDVLEERQKIKNTSDLDTSDYGIALTAGLVAGTVNQLTGGMAGLNKGVAAGFIKDGIAKMDASAFKKVTAAVGVGTLEEATEESIQELAQIVGSKLDTVKENEILSKETALDLGVAAALGGGAGGVMSGSRSIADEVVNTTRNNKDDINDEQVKPVTASDEISRYERELASGNVTFSRKELNDFLTKNTNTLSDAEFDRFETVYNDYKEKVKEVYKPDGTVDGAKLRSNPVLVDDILRQINKVDESKLEQFVDSFVNKDVLTNHTDEEIEDIKARVKSLRGSEVDTDEMISSLESVQSDIFTGGFLKHSSLVKAIETGTVEDKAKFFGYEEEKLNKLKTATDTVQSNIMNMVGNDTNKLLGLAYLEGLNVQKGKGTVSKELESVMLQNARALLGSTEFDGNKLREEYKNSNLKKSLDSNNVVIDGFTNERYSTNDGKYEVKAWQALSDMIDTKGQGELQKSGHGKLIIALEAEVSMLDKVVSGEVNKESLIRELVGRLSENTVKSDVIDKPAEKVQEVKEKEVDKTVENEFTRNATLDQLLAMSEKTNEESKRLSPKDTAAKERELKIQMLEKVKLYREYSKWVDESYKDLKVVYAELNKAKEEYSRLSAEVKTKYSEERKDLKNKIKEADKTIEEIKQKIVEAKKDKEEIKSDKKLDQVSPRLREIKSKIENGLLSVVSVIKSINELLNKLYGRKDVETAKKNELVSRLRTVNDRMAEEFRDLKNSKKNKVETLTEKKVEILEDIDQSTVSKAELKAEIKDLKKKIAEVKNAYKADEKSLAAKRLEKTTGFPGFSKPINIKQGDTNITTASALNEVLEVSNGIAPLAVTSYRELVGENAEEYNEVIKDVAKVLVADGTYVNESFNNAIVSKVVKDSKDNRKIQEDKRTKQWIALNAPAMSLLIKDNKEFGIDSVDENLALALEVGMLDWVANDAMTSDEITAKDVAKYYGVDESEVSSEMIEEAQRLGIPARFVVEGIGNKILTQAGYKMTNKPVADKLELITRLKESLGMYAIQLASNRGYVEFSRKGYLEIAELMGRNVEAERAKDKSLGEVSTPLVKFTMRAPEAKEVLDRRKNDLGIVETYNGVKFERPRVKDLTAAIKRNKVTVAPKALLEAKKDMMLREWHIKGLDDGDSVIKEFFEMDPEMAMKAMGLKTEDEIKELPYSMRKAAYSKNKQIRRSVESIREVAEKIKDGVEENSIWYDVFIGKNSREYLDSDGVNNQSDKLHRHIMYTDGQETEIVKGTKIEKLFLIGVAQAFGYDTDKKKIEDSIEFGKMILDNADKVEAGWESIKAGATELKIGNEKIKVKSLGHVLDGIQAVREYKEANGKPFVTKLLIETDAVTSGFGLKLLQYIQSVDESLGFTDTTLARDWLEKVGMFVGKDGQLLGSSIVDSYKTLAKEMSDKAIVDTTKEALGNKKKLKELLKYLPEEDEKSVVNEVRKVTRMLTDVIGKLTDDKGEVTKMARDLFKPPFMTFMYGAGFRKIKKELAGMVIEKVLEKVAEYKKLGKSEKEALDKLLMKVTGRDTAEEAYQLFMDKDIKTYKVNGRSLEEIMEGYVSATFGNTVESIMTKKFGKIIEINEAVMEVTSAVFGVWNKKFEERLGGVGLTLDNVDEITAELVNDFPIVRGPLSEGVNDGIALFKTEIARGLKELIKSKYSDAGMYIDENGKLTHSGVSHVIRLYKEAAAAAGVIPIHTLDSSIMTQTVMGAPAMQIWDAIVTGIGNVEKLGKDYNRNVFEISMKWNFLEEVLNTANRVLGNSENGKYLEMFLKEKTAESDKKGREYDLEGSIEKLISSAKGNREFKEDFKQKGGIIDHMVFNEETRYEIGKDSPTSPEEILKIVDPKVMKKINEKLGDTTLEKLFEECMKG